MTTMLCVINTLASLLTATALLLHAVLGCCVHHHHGHPPLIITVPGAGSAPSMHSRTAVDSHRGHHQHEAGCPHDHVATAHDTADVAGGTGDSGCDERHNHHAPCEDGSCQWVGTEAPAKVSPDGSSLPDFPAPALTVLTACLLLDLQPGTSGGEAGAAMATDAPRSGLALRQVWRL